MNRIANRAILDALAKELKGEEYEYIPKVIGRQDYHMDWNDVTVKENRCLQIHRHGTLLITINWSWNEPKVYFDSGVLQMRIIATEEALLRAFDALDVANKAFTKHLAEVEM